MTRLTFTRGGRLLAGTSALALAASLVPSLASAAALERAVPSTTRILFEEGRYIEFGLAYADPDQRGDDALVPAAPIAPLLGFTGNTGDLFEDHVSVSAAYKSDLTEQLSYAILFDQPFGADTQYGAGTMTSGIPGLDFTYDGTSADLNTYQLTGVLAYDVRPDVKLFGGLRAQRLDADAAIVFIDDYSIDADADWGYGYLLGAAYSRPDIALRVAFTYHSEIEHDLDTAEFTNTTGDVDTDTDIATPQSATLEFQTGVAQGTLVFGSVRWVDWSEFAIEPPLYGQAVASVIGEPRPLVDYADDWWTYTLGIGRQFTPTLAGSLALSHEPDVGGELTTLGPYDGRTTATAALSYDYGQFNVSGGLTYGVLGDTSNVLQTDFNDGSVWGAGLRVGYSF